MCVSVCLFVLVCVCACRCVLDRKFTLQKESLKESTCMKVMVLFNSDVQFLCKMIDYGRCHFRRFRLCLNHVSGRWMMLIDVSGVCVCVCVCTVSAEQVWVCVRCV